MNLLTYDEFKVIAEEHTAVNALRIALAKQDWFTADDATSKSLDVLEEAIGDDVYHPALTYGQYVRNVCNATAIQESPPEKWAEMPIL